MGSERTACVCVLACVTIYVALAQTTAARLVLPIEVLGDDGTVVAVTVVLTPEQAGSAKSLWLRINGLRYPGQGSVQINNASWIALTNETVNVGEPGKSYGGIGGGFATLAMTLPLARNSVVAGTNTIRFRFDHSDSVSSGFRVLAWNLVRSDGRRILSLEQFVEENPDTWGPPSADHESIQAGRELWHSASLRANNAPHSPTIQAHCADCHSEDGRDLKYFNFSNYSIITRSRFHGLSTSQGEEIASYIRSLPVENPGRPWNPPYQPGPGLETKPISNWAAGAGLEWVLDQDVDALPYLVRSSGTSLVTRMMSPSDVRELTSQITPDAFSPDNNLNAREIPIALQLPDWSEWLPRIHPKDAWGSAFDGSELNKFYRAQSSRNGNIGQSRLRAVLSSSQNSQHELRPVVLAFARWSDARRRFLKSIAPKNTQWSPSLTDRVYSTQLWQLVKTWELTQEFGLEGRGRELYGPVADSRTWLNTIPGETAPAVAHIPNGVNGVGGSALTNTYLTAAWYELQVLLNSGNHQHQDREPVDWLYVVNSFRDLYNETHQPRPTQLLIAVTKALQSTDRRLGPDDLRRGWRPDQSIDPRILISPAWAPLFSSLPAEVHRAITDSVLRAWIDKTQQYSISRYLPLGLPPQSYPNKGYGDISGGEVWKAAQQFQQAGVSPDLIERLGSWGQAYTDRAARLQYNGRSSSARR